MVDRSVAQKLQIKPGHRIAALNAPEGYARLLGGLPDGAVVDEAVELGTAAAAGSDVIHLFVRNRAELVALAPGVLAQVGPATILWISYPKRSPSRSADLTRDAGWDPVREAGFDPVSQVAIDETWSALRFRRDPSLRAARVERGAKGYRDADIG